MRCFLTIFLSLSFFYLLVSRETRDDHTMITAMGHAQSAGCWIGLDSVGYFFFLFSSFLLSRRYPFLLSLAFLRLLGGILFTQIHSEGVFGHTQDAAGNAGMHPSAQAFLEATIIRHFLINRIEWHFIFFFARLP